MSAQWTTRLGRFGYWEDDGPEIAWVDGPWGDNDCKTRAEASIRDLVARAVAAETALARATSEWETWRTRATEAETALAATDEAVTELLMAIAAEQPGFQWTAERTADAVDVLTKVVLPLAAVPDQPNPTGDDDE